MRYKTHLLALIAILVCVHSARTDSTEAACEIYPRGEDHTEVLIPCRFSQTQGHVVISRSDGVVHDLMPVGDSPGRHSAHGKQSGFHRGAEPGG